MNTKIKKWGNSFGVRIPKDFIDDLKLENASVSVSMVGGSIVIKPIKIKPVYTLENLVSKITKHNQHPEIDWGEDVGEEIVEWNEKEAFGDSTAKISNDKKSKNEK